MLCFCFLVVWYGGGKVRRESTALIKTYTSNKLIVQLVKTTSQPQHNPSHPYTIIMDGRSETVTLESREHFQFIIDRDAACVSNTIRNMLSSQGVSLLPLRACHHCISHDQANTSPPQTIPSHITQYHQATLPRQSKASSAFQTFPHPFWRRFANTFTTSSSTKTRMCTPTSCTPTCGCCHAPHAPLPLLKHLLLPTDQARTFRSFRYHQNWHWSCSWQAITCTYAPQGHTTMGCTLYGFVQVAYTV